MALAVVLLIQVPVLNVVALLLILVPYTILYTQLDRKSFVVHVIGIMVVGCLIIDPFVFLSASILALIPSIYMGSHYKKSTPSIQIIPKATVLTVVLLMLQLFVIENVIKVSMLKDMHDSIAQMMNDISAQGLSPVVWNNDMTDSFVKLVMNMIPFVFLIISFFIVLCSHLLARRLVKLDGILVPSFPKAKDWRLPRSLVFLYLVAYLLEFTANPTDTSFLTLALANLVPTLSFLFAIQAVGFFYYIAHTRNWPKIIPFLIAIPVIIIPPFSIIGILDIAFPLRKYFSKQP